MGSIRAIFSLREWLCSYSNSRGQLESSVAEEKRYNPRLTKDIDTFVDIMDNLNLPKPKKIGKQILNKYGGCNMCLVVWWGNNPLIQLINCNSLIK